MKKTYFILLLLICFNAKAGSCSANGTSTWETATNWSCGHIPGAGDIVTIDAGKIITVTTTNSALIGNLNVSGTLTFTNGSKITLAATSVVNVYSGGSIGGGNGGAKLVFPSASYSGPFSTTGPFNFTNGGSGTGVLPLTLLSFNSSRQNEDIVLYWKTANEENVNFFQIESSQIEPSGSANSDWQLLETIPSMATNEGGYSYSFTDQSKMNGDRYYRLKMVDRDGKYAYSKVVFISFRQTTAISITPTLVYSSINVSLPASGRTQIAIYNAFGLLVKTLSTETDRLNIDVSRLTRGEYFLQVLQENNSYITKFLKQ